MTPVCRPDFLAFPHQQGPSSSATSVSSTVQDCSLRVEQSLTHHVIEVIFGSHHIFSHRRSTLRTVGLLGTNFQQMEPAQTLI